jgi:hypothetical protein
MSVDGVHGASTLPSVMNLAKDDVRLVLNEEHGKTSVDTTVMSSRIGCALPIL